MNRIQNVFFVKIIVKKFGHIKKKQYLYIAHAKVSFQMISPYRVEITRYRRKRRRLGALHRKVDVVDVNTGEATAATLSAEAIEDKILDGEQYIKLYKPSSLLGLSSSGLGVLLFIMDNLSFDGSVTIDVKRCMMYAGYRTRKSVYDGIADLARRDVIRHRVNDTYWVNPNIVYRGQRNEFTIIRK